MASITLHRKSKNQPCWRLSYFDVRENKWRQMLLHCSRDEAEQIRKKVEAEFTWYAANPHLLQSTTNHSLGSVVDQFLKAKDHEVASSTVTRYRFGLNYILDILGKDYPINSISQKDIDKIISSCQETRFNPTPDNNGLSLASTNTVLRHLRALLNWSYDRDMIDKVPRVKQLKTQKQAIQWLSHDEVSSILKNSPEDIADLVRLYILTGARRSELLFTTWRDIDLKRKRIQLRDVKSKRQEYLYLSDEAIRILRKYAKVKPRPFKFTQDQLRHRYQKSCDAAKVDSTIHDLRRTCGARLIEKGVDIFRVSKFLRHSSVKVTQEHYVDLLPDDYSNIADTIQV